MDGSDTAPKSVRVTPEDMLERHRTEWTGLDAEIVTARRQCSFEYKFHAAERHLLMVGEQSERVDGETLVDGLPKSTQRELSYRMTFIPAGCKFYGWQTPSVLTRCLHIHIDRHCPLLDDETRFSEIEFRPKLFFFDAELWRLADRLKNVALTGARQIRYGEALGVMLGHELIRINGGATLANAPMRGGLSERQRRKVVDYIEAHVAEALTLSTLAGVVGLGPYHFARAFKQSVGMPPHRYHQMRRLEHAKTLLISSRTPITEIALSLGYTDSSAFSTTFRKLTGTTPRDFRRERS